MADQIAQHFQRKWNIANQDEDPHRYLHLLVAYLSRCPKIKLDNWEEEDGWIVVEKDMEEEDERKEEGEQLQLHELEDCNEKSEDTEKGHYENDTSSTGAYKCLICDSSFADRKGLTGHYQRHIEQNIFDEPLQCPACRRKGTISAVEEGYLPWLNHLERFHGKDYVPYLPRDQGFTPKYPCPFSDCGKHANERSFSSTGLTAHLSRCHVDAQNAGHFENAVQCHRCISDETECSSVPLIRSIVEWRLHFDAFHRDDQGTVYQCLLCL